MPDVTGSLEPDLCVITTVREELGKGMDNKYANEKENCG